MLPQIYNMHIDLEATLVVDILQEKNACGGTGRTFPSLMLSGFKASTNLLN